MRMTIRLDEDLHQALWDATRREGVTLSDMFNRALRFGLAEPKQRAPAGGPKKKRRSLHQGEKRNAGHSK